LGGLQGAGNLGVRDSEKARYLLGQRLIGGEPGELALPEIEITPGKLVEFAGIVVFGRHAATIAHQWWRASAEHPFRTRKARLVALRYRR